MRVLAPKTIYTKLLTVLFVITLVFQFSFINAQYEWRYKTWRNEGVRGTRLIEHKGKIQEYIPKEALVIAPEDGSPNYALSIMERNGWSGYQLDFNRYSIDQMIQNGAQYMVFYNTDSIPDKFSELNLETVYKTDHFLILAIK